MEKGSKFVRGKLLPLDEVKRMSRRVDNNSQTIQIYHSKCSNCLTVYRDKSYKFGTVVDVSLSQELSNRSVYKDYHDGSNYYDEWFEWIGEEPVIIEPLSDSLWDISDW